MPSSQGLLSSDRPPDQSGSAMQDGLEAMQASGGRGSSEGQRRHGMGKPLEIGHGDADAFSTTQHSRESFRSPSWT